MRSALLKGAGNSKAAFPLAQSSLPGPGTGRKPARDQGLGNALREQQRMKEEEGSMHKRSRGCA